MSPYTIQKATLLLPLRSPAGPDGVGVVVKELRSYRSRSELSVTVLTEPSHRDGELVEDADTTAVHKPCSDVVVVGSAYAPSPRSHIDVSVEVGAARRRVRVHGERRVRVRPDGRVDFEQLGSVQEARLTFREAYGGALHRPAPSRRGRFGARENADLENARTTYPRNPIGRGFEVAANGAHLDGTLAPSQEDPDDPVRPASLLRRFEADWVGAPLPGGLGPIDALWFPRGHHLMPFSFEPGAVPREVTMGILSAADLQRRPFPPDPRVLSCGAPGLAVPHLTGRESLKLQGTRWGRGGITFGLDAAPPRIRLVFPGAGAYDLAPRLGMVRVDADEETVTLVWGAFQPTAMPYPEDQLSRVRLEVQSR